jgi:putative redox protein
VSQKQEFHRGVVSVPGVCQNRGVVDIYVEYQGDLHCSAQHGPSGAVLATDAPVDNHGRGESFSPTDLVATALGTCMATVMGILARKREQTLTGTKIHVKKQMTPPPRRIARLAVALSFPPEVTASVGPDGRAALEHEALNCPVRLSLLDAIEVPVEFDWQSR